MKKIFLTALIGAMMSSNVAAAQINVMLNDKAVEFPNQQPVIYEGRTLIPLRGVFESLGYEITWDNETKTAHFKKDGSSVDITADMTYFIADGNKLIDIDVPAKIISGSMLLPLRAVGEATGLDVTWDDDTKTVKLSEKPTEISSEDMLLINMAVRTTTELSQYGALWDSYLYNDYVNSGYVYDIINNYGSEKKLIELLDTAIKECENYKTVAKGLNNTDSKVIDKFCAYVDLDIAYTKVAKELLSSEKYDNMTEEELEALCEKETEEISNSLQAFSDLVDEISDSVNMDKNTEYQVYDIDKLEGTNKADVKAYLSNTAAAAQTALEFLDSEKSSTESGDSYRKAASQIRDKLNSTEAPRNCTTNKEVIIAACDFLDKAGKAVDNGAYADDEVSAVYIEYDVYMIAFDSLLSLALGDYYESVIYYYSDDDYNGGNYGQGEVPEVKLVKA